MSRRPLTSKQNDFLTFLVSHVRERQVWPTYREIVDRFGYRSPNSVTQNLQALTKKGFLERDHAGGYRIVHRPGGLLAEGIPIEGSITDGTLAEEPGGEALTLAALFDDLDNLRAFRLESEARTGLLADADYVIVDTPSVREGDRAAVLVDGNVEVRRVSGRGSAMRLLPLEGVGDALTTEDGPILLGRYAGCAGSFGLLRAKPQQATAPTRSFELGAPLSMI
jgi:repressor LexA